MKIKAVQANGECVLENENPMGPNNVEEIFAELGIEEAGVEEFSVAPAKLASSIAKYQRAKGYSDPEDWIDGMMEMIRQFSLEAADKGATEIVFTE